LIQNHDPIRDACSECQIVDGQYNAAALIGH
jgi:hypothetical protein